MTIGFLPSRCRIKPNQRPVAYCTGLQYGTKEDWEFLWRQYYNSNSATDQVVMLEALGCTKNKTLLEKSVILFVLVISRLSIFM